MRTLNRISNCNIQTSFDRDGFAHKMDKKVPSFLLVACVFVLFSSITALTTTPSTISNKSTTSAPITHKPSPSCESQNASCGTCTDDSSCFWCASDSSCKKYPASKIVPQDCKGNKWYFQQCFAPGYILIIVVPSVCGALLLIFGCCIYCCCCRSKSSGADRETRRIRQRREDARQRSEGRRNDRKKRTDAIRQKYGLLNNEDDNEVV